MEYLIKETEQFDKRLQKECIPLDYAFFTETNYKGLESHQEAAIQLIRTLNEKRGFDSLPDVDSNDNRLTQDPTYEHKEFFKEVKRPTSYVVSSKRMSSIQIVPPRDFFTPVEKIREDEPSFPVHWVDENGRLPFRERMMHNTMFRHWLLGDHIPEESFTRTCLKRYY